MTFAARAVLGLTLVAPIAAAPLPAALVSLDVLPPSRPGFVPEAAPARFVLLEDGTVYVGGTSEIASGKLDGGEVKELERQIDRVRKLPGLGATVRFGAGATRYRLSIRKAADIAVTGDPAEAPAPMRPLASLLDTLAAFEHASLHPYRPTQFALVAHEAPILGGCRRWAFPVPLPDAAAAARTVSADAAADWTTGALAASVCAENKTYLVTLRPLLPGEKP